MSCETEGEYTWRLVAGDDSTRTFEYRNSEDDPIDLTGCTAVCIVDVGTVTQNVPGVVGGSNGQVTITLEDSLTTLFRGNGEYRVRLTMAGGAKHTLVYGNLVVKQ